ncbi:hypothetical protein DM01DRAFT_1197639 [Hesseltinella vesiculosa]|uniref:HNH nuclease domain-containing protein n=1 Tax=Hesseltinella vesiculosa TaxID=101127 RepID=A0A1X2G3G5_9FUNG|nr:hypothetical protein DM01DRAFT_1197639 [Hesseltinella vesiculosa]
MQVLTPWTTVFGYHTVHLLDDSNTPNRLWDNPTTATVHSLVIHAFVRPRPDGMVIDHINAIKTDNRVANLRYLTPCHLCRPCVQFSLCIRWLSVQSQYARSLETKSSIKHASTKLSTKTKTGRPTLMAIEAPVRSPQLVQNGSMRQLESSTTTLAGTITLRTTIAQHGCANFQKLYPKAFTLSWL